MRLACAVTLLLMSGGALAQIAGLDGEYRKTDIEIKVENGTTMYALVREFYPRRMNRWLAVAADIAAVNPQAFRNGDPANMIVGRSLLLIDYGDGIAGEPAVAPTPAPGSAAADAAPTPAPSSTARPTGQVASQPQAGEPATTGAATPTGTVPSAAGQVAIRMPADGGVPGTSADVLPTVPATPATAVRIGRIDQLEGTPVVIDASGAQRALAVNDAVHTGEMLVAGDDGRLVLAMIDRAAIEVVAGGRVLFEQYAFDETAPGSVSVMTLLAGGVRVKTGLIGTRRPGAVSVNTPVATVTVQGTRFSLSLCGDNTCRVSGRDRALSEGLYAGVVEGAVNIANNTGDTTVARGDVVHVRNADAHVEAATDARTLVFTDAELAALRIEIDRPLGFWEWFRQRFFGID